MASLSFDRGTVEAVARKTGFRRGGVEKALRLVAFLDELSRDRYMGPRTVLKGGTGLNLFHGPLRRLSIDADLDYIGAIDLAGMKAERPMVLETLDDIGVSLGYRPRRLKDGHAGTVTHFRYRSISGADELIKVDLNFLERVPVLGRVDRLAPNRDLMFEGVSVPCLPADELAGSKLATLCLRGAPRDLFDVGSLGSLNLNGRTVRKVALFHGFLEGLDLANFDVEAAARVSAKSLKDKVAALLPRDDPLDRAALVAKAEKWTKTLLPLSGSELRFQERLRMGVVEPRLLFEEIPIHPRLAEHPGISRRLTVKRPPR